MNANAELRRDDFRYLDPIATRWMDNDVYRHVNNVVYYSYFDTCANNYLIREAGLDIEHSPVIGFIVHSECDYFRPIVHPARLEIALRVNRLGRSSVEYGLGVYSEGEEKPHAVGAMVHVFVDRASESSAPIPEPLRVALARLLVE